MINQNVKPIIFLSVLAKLSPQFPQAKDKRYTQSYTDPRSLDDDPSKLLAGRKSKDQGSVLARFAKRYLSRFLNRTDPRLHTA